MAMSQLRPVAVAVVAVNKKRSSKIIEVADPEQNPFLDGELTDNVQEIQVQGSGANGAAFDIKLKATATKQATWIPFGSNRVTAPDVRRGEKVQLWQFADDDKFYWTDIGLDEHLRKLETVVFRLSGSQVEADGIDPTKDYYLEVSTHDGLIHLHTSAANGEPYEWDIQLNTKESILLARDSLGNFGTIESKEGHIEFQNFKGTFFRLVGKDVFGYASGTTNWSCPMTNWTGDFSLKGNFTLTGNYAQTGNFVLNGDGNCTGTFTAGKLVSVSPAEAPNID
jgi:hypothetical protein